MSMLAFNNLFTVVALCFVCYDSSYFHIFLIGRPGGNRTPVNDFGDRCNSIIPLAHISCQFLYLNTFMNTLMFINPLDRFQSCYIAPDDAQYGRFMCVYSTGESLQQFKRHQKCGFKSHAEAISWYLSRFPNGNVVSPREFLELQGQMLTMKLPNAPSIFNPTHMTEKSRPIAAKRDRSGKIISDFE